MANMYPSTDPSSGDEQYDFLGKLLQLANTGLSVVLAAGSAILGKVGIDQTTPGVTNAVQKKQSNAAPTNTAGAAGASTPFTIITGAARDVFTLAVGDRGFIQNHDTDVLCVKLGTGASNSSFSFRLKACAVADDGSGGYIPIENWTGVVSVAPATGDARFSAWKV